MVNLSYRRVGMMKSSWRELRAGAGPDGWSVVVVIPRETFERCGVEFRLDAVPGVIGRTDLVTAMVCLDPHDGPAFGTELFDQCLARLPLRHRSKAALA